MRTPVARFVAVVVGLAVVLGALAWTGAGAPAVEAQPMGEGTAREGELGYLLAVIENRGSLPVRITDASWASDGLHETAVFVGPEAGAPDGMERFVPFTLAGGERRAVMVRGAIDCPLPGEVVTVSTDPLRITAEPALGPRRTLVMAATGRGQGMERTLPCPGR